MLTSLDVIDHAAQTLSIPRAAPADSFVLHAPLELLARVGLLPYLDEADRPAALDAIGQLADRYEQAGDAVDPPAPAEFHSDEAAGSRLASALAAGDLDEVDRVASWLTANVGAHRLRGLLGGQVVTSLAAAGHAPIALHLLPRVHHGRLPASLLRGPLRELARNPEWRLRWFDVPTPDERGADLLDALLEVPHLGRPGSDFIHPLMSNVERTGVAEAVLRPVLAPRFDVPAATATLGRVAAWSMLFDDPEQAPYGWTHCLTMPQAVMGLAGAGVPARTALAVAATFVVGFRAASGLVPLDARLSPGEHVPGEPGALAAYASTHLDAHLVKYTLACLHAAEDDPAARTLYLATAARLADWWRHRG